MGTTTLYRYFDGDDVLLYVGISLNAVLRLAQHSHAGAEWTASIARSTFQHFPTRVAALAAEKTAIQTEKPRFNVVHNRPAKEKKESTRRSLPTHDELTVFEPIEMCYASGGVLLSARTHGAPKMKFYSVVIPIWQTLNYREIAQWMEHFDYVFENGYVVSKDGKFCAEYRAVLTYIDVNWRREFGVENQSCSELTES